MERFTEALIFAAEAHDGQTYGDLPYIAHPLAVATALRQAGADEDEVVAGLLHDVLEDCPIVSHHMLENRFGTEVFNIVIGLTHPEHQSYEQYVDSMPERSKRVKFFDSLGNYKGLSSPYLKMSDAKKAKLTARYERNLATLYPAVRDLALEPEDRAMVEALG